MSYKISKELFEAVMQYECEYIDIRTNIIVAFSKNSELDMIHIDSFFFKCKEFAYINLCLLCSNNNSQGGVCELLIIGDARDNKLFEANSEQQSCFDAAQWILENK